MYYYVIDEHGDRVTPAVLFYDRAQRWALQLCLRFLDTFEVGCCNEQDLPYPQVDPETGEYVD